MPKLTWTVEIAVDETWIADGFDLTDKRAQDIMERALPYARGDEIACRVTSRPDDEAIATLQGYRSVEEWRHANGCKR